MPRKTQLTDAEILDTVLRFGTITEAARQLGVCRSTLSKRVNSDSYKELLSAYQEEVLDQTAAKLLQMNEEALMELHELITNDQSPRTRLAAVKTILAETKEYLMLSRLQNQIKELERIIQQ